MAPNERPQNSKVCAHDCPSNWLMPGTQAVVILALAAPYLLTALKDLVSAIEAAADGGVDFDGRIGLGPAHQAIRIAEGRWP